MCNIAHHFSGKLTIPLLVFHAIVLIAVVVALPSYADPNFTWDRAAYWDVRYPTCFTSGRLMRDALEFAGYKILDANQLKTWMDARISEGMPSVVVFCRDIAPDTVVESMSSRCTLRRYLDAGGKIVWYADIPMYYQGHVDGTRTGWGPNGSINILGFNAEGAPWDREEEVVFTREGLNWGLTETWQSKRPTSPSGLRVLAKDASGYAAAWVKHYVPGDSYRGFVRLFDQIGVPNFNDVQRVAEYPNVPEPIVYYVDDDATGANDGSSWADAYWFLQDALAAWRYGDEIRVAQGNYKPDQQVVITARGPQIRGSGDRTETFQLINGVSIKGGYAGFGETDPDARDIEAYRTILSGDLNGNDGPNFANNDENSYHVVTGSGTDETAVLDGFTITAGYANGFGNPNDSGGGMYSTSGSPTVINCTFSKNAAGYAGGMANRDYCSPTVINCTFVGNSAHSGGVGMFDWHSASTLINCSFSGNFGRYGAAMRIYDSDSTIINCSFSGNFARQYGGAIYLDRSDVTLTNCTFSSNSADYWELGCGGGIYNHVGNSSLTLTNCIFWNNSDSGGVNESAQIHGGTPVVNYCCIQGWTGTWEGLGNMGANPMFARNPNDGGDDWGVGNRKEFGDLLSIGRNDDFGDLHLRSQAGRWDTNSQSWIQDDVTSPCIDAGDNSAIPAGVIVDLDGNPRIINGIVDMGAYEVGMAPPPPILSEALDTDLSITTGGSTNWFGQTTTSYYDGDAAQSGDISRDQESWIQTTVNGAGTVRFYWKVSSEDNFDFLEFYIDGSLEGQISGSVNWQQKTYTISTLGSHTLEWRYVKDKGTDSGSDCGWVDKLEWVPTPPPDPLSEALDTDLSITTGGNEDWFNQTTTSQYGGDAAQSGDISHNQESWMQTTVNGTGTVAFYWKVSSEEDFDFLEFYIDGSLQEDVSGLEGWEQETYTISTLGSHTLEWRYVKDKGTDSGSDCGWVDKVEWVTN